MALLDWITPGDSLRLRGEGIEIRPPRPSDFPEWSELRRASRDFLQPWEPTWPEDDLTRAAWRRRLASYARDIDLGVAYPFLVFRLADGALTGGITLSNIRRGVAQMGTVGYWCGVSHTRQGHTLAAVRTVVGFAFRTLALQLLHKAGFDSPEEAWEAHRDELPSESCFVIDAVERPVPEPPSGDPLLTALVLGRCSGSLFSPNRPIIWSERRLARSIRLVRCQPDTFLDDDLT